MKKPTIVCVIDAGGRGSALVYKYGQSPHVDELIAIPGNDWMQELIDKKVTTYPQLKTTSIKEIIAICQEKRVSLVDVAQDNAVAVGLVDSLASHGIVTIGPTKTAGEIEWNKAFARKLLAKASGINQPPFTIFQSQSRARQFLQTQKDQRWFVKAAGLCEGKGVLPAKTISEALARIAEMKRFGHAGKTFLLEQWLANEDNSQGEEFSAFALCNGTSYQLIGFAQDHKRIYNFDEGENTGGIGAVTPPLLISPAITKQVHNIFTTTLKALKASNRRYTGILYLGGMVVKQREQPVPYVIEFNARWGDPEAEVLVPGITNDLYEVSRSVAENGRIPQLAMDKKTRVCLTGCARGYPYDHTQAKGKRIFGLQEAQKLGGIIIFGSGMTTSGTKQYVSGGRIFHIVAEGSNIIEARERAYHAMSRISIEGNNLHYRIDIGWRDVDRLRRAH